MLHCSLGYIDPISQNAQIEPQDFRLRFYVALIELKMRSVHIYYIVPVQGEGGGDQFLTIIAASSSTKNWWDQFGVLTGPKVNIILLEFCGKRIFNPGSWLGSLAN